MSHLLIIALLLPHFSWAQHISDLQTQIKTEQATRANLIAEAREMNRLAEVSYETSSRVDNINHNALRNLSAREVNMLYADLKPFYCVGGAGTSLATGRNICDAHNRNCNRPMDCPIFSSVGPGTSELLKKIGLEPPSRLPASMDAYREELHKWQRLFHGIDYKVNAQLKDREIQKTDNRISQIQAQIRKIEDQRGDLTRACQTFLAKTKNKISLDPKLTDLSGHVPAKISSDQASQYIRALHKGLTRASALPDPQERVESFKNLRMLAEVLACNGHEEKVRRQIDELETQLLASYEKSGNTNCSTAGATDRAYRNFEECMSTFLDSMPTALNDLNTNVKKVQSHIKEQQPAGVLDRIAKDQIRNAVDNLTAVHQIYDLDTGSSTSGKTVNDVCYGVGSCGQFTNYINTEVYRSKNTNRGFQKVPNCGGGQLSLAQNRFKQLMQGVVQKHQYSGTKRDESVMADTQSSLEQLSNEFPDLASLFYSPEFIAQAEVDLDDMEMKFKPSGCDKIKDGLRKALQENIQVIANPAAKDRVAESISRFSQKTKRLLSNFRMIPGTGVPLLAINPNLSTDFSDIDELYREVPELRGFPKDQIHHLKMILKHRPELREHYMREFEGNAALICFLFKGIKKDGLRDLVVENEMKFVKGVAKGIGTAMAVASFMVNPGLGILLGTAVAGTSSVVSSAGTISSLTNRLNQAKAERGKLLNECVQGLTSSPRGRTYSDDLKAKHCADAVDTMARAADIEKELRSTYVTAAVEIGLYSVYLAKIGPQALSAIKGGSHGAHSAVTHSAEAIAKSGGRFSPAKMWDKIAHHDNVYGAAKSAKALYYAANAPKMAYIFSDPVQNGFYHASVEEELHRRQKTKGSRLSEVEIAAIEQSVKSKVRNLSEAAIIDLINKEA